MKHLHQFIIEQAGQRWAEKRVHNSGIYACHQLKIKHHQKTDEIDLGRLIGELLIIEN
jgi:hypothetical protein